MDEPMPRPQLMMLWPLLRRGAPALPPVREGYALRQFKPDDARDFFRLMERAGWPDWDAARLRPWQARIPVECWFVVEQSATGQLVASAMGLDDSSPRWPGAGELGWVAADPEHRGRGLGSAVSAAVTARLVALTFRRVHLYTEDDRLAALRMYLRLGYQPYLSGPGMAERWQAVCAAIGRPFTPGAWPGE